jgi:hypothetical protein
MVDNAYLARTGLLAGAVIGGTADKFRIRRDTGLTASEAALRLACLLPLKRASSDRAPVVESKSGTCGPASLQIERLTTQGAADAFNGPVLHPTCVHAGPRDRAGHAWLCPETVHDFPPDAHLERA